MFLDCWILGHVELKKLLTTEITSGSETMYLNEYHKKGLHFCWQRSEKHNCYFMKARQTQKAVSTAQTRQRGHVCLKPGICTGHTQAKSTLQLKLSQEQLQKTSDCKLKAHQVFINRVLQRIKHARYQYSILSMNLRCHKEPE